MLYPYIKLLYVLTIKVKWMNEPRKLHAFRAITIMFRHHISVIVKSWAIHCYVFGYLGPRHGHSQYFYPAYSESTWKYNNAGIFNEDWDDCFHIGPIAMRCDALWWGLIMLYFYFSAALIFHGILEWSACAAREFKTLTWRIQVGHGY